jgi:hypothetical protein
LLLLLAVAAFLFLFRLDHRPFWQDEAETACLARNVLKYGVPRAYDGVNLISQENGQEFGPDYLWRWSPWLQIYLAASAFWLGGLTTWMGRYPFVLAGLLCIGMVYLLIRHGLGNTVWAWLAAACLTLSVPFLLFARQCRYYALAAFLVTISLSAFRADWQHRAAPAAILVASLIALLHTNYLVFLCFVPSFGAAVLLFYRRQLPLRRTLLLVVLTVALTLPALTFFRFWQHGTPIHPPETLRHLGQYSIDVFQFMLPLPLLLLVLWLCGRSLLPDRWVTAGPAPRSASFRPRPPVSGLSEDQRWVLFLLVILLGNLMIISLLPIRFHRYLAHLYPLTAMIAGWALWMVWSRRWFWGLGLFLLLCLTNYLHVLPLQWLGVAQHPPGDRAMLTSANLPLQLYFTELLSPYPDVNQSLITFFQQHAKPGDLIWVNYGDLPLQFYTSLPIRGGLQPTGPAPQKPYNWVVKRQSFPYQVKYNHNDDLCHSQPSPAQYEKIVLPYPDEPFGNRSDPIFHRFISPTGLYPDLVVYRLLSGDRK